jgi:hypothetical protein
MKTRFGDEKNLVRFNKHIHLAESNVKNMIIQYILQTKLFSETASYLCECLPLLK